MATRDSRATMERLLTAEMDRLRREEAEEADNDLAPPDQPQVGASGGRV